MGIISEARAAESAKRLEEIILKAISDSEYKDCRSCVKGFVRNEIYPLYISECEDSYGMHSPNKDIQKIFEGEQGK